MCTRKVWKRPELVSQIGFLKMVQAFALCWHLHYFVASRNFRPSSSSLVMPSKAVAVTTYRAGTFFILLPVVALRRSFCTSGSAPTFKNILYASGIGRVFAIRPCLTRLRWYAGAANVADW